jgi:hypothetical protein
MNQLAAQYPSFGQMLWYMQVPSSVFEWPAAAFAGVLVLNVLNLLLRQNRTKLWANQLLLFINSVAFTTDILIHFDLTPVLQASNGRM